VTHIPVSEYRSAERVRKVGAEIKRITTRQWTIMEICGGQTHAILQYGLDQLLPDEIELVHGPGCPVCVIFCSFGDMLRVPGSSRDLFSVRANGGQVRVVYSPLDCIKIAQENPDRQIVFFAIGFETTAPSNVAAILQAEALGIKNFSVLVSQVCVPPAMHAILGSPNNRVQGFLAAGHVCSVMGYWEYPDIAARYQIPMTVTGFEPLDLMNGILMTVRQLEQCSCRVENAYSRVVTLEGNSVAQSMIRRVYEPIDRMWRGIGHIPMSGWGLRQSYAQFDAEQRFDIGYIQTRESDLCIAGQVLQGIAKPADCPAFGIQCTPQNPLGAPMVSSEGACNAYFRYGRK